MYHGICYFFFCKQKTAYEMRISDWSSDVCSSDLTGPRHGAAPAARESVDGLDFFRTVPPPKTMSPIGELREIGAFAARIGEAIDAFKPDLLHAQARKSVV